MIGMVRLILNVLLLMVLGPEKGFVKEWVEMILSMENQLMYPCLCLYVTDCAFYLSFILLGH